MTLGFALLLGGLCAGAARDGHRKQSVDPEAAASRHCPALFDRSARGGMPSLLNRGIAGLGAQGLSSFFRAGGAGLRRASLSGVEEGTAGHAASSVTAEYGGEAGERLRVTAFDLIHVCDAGAGTGEALRGTSRGSPPAARRELTAQGHPAVLLEAASSRALRVYLRDRCELWLEDGSSRLRAPLTDYLAVLDLAGLAAACARR